MKKIFTPTFFAIAALIIIVAVVRFLPIPNFTPIAAIALFGCAYFKRKSIAFLIPLAIYAITNLFLGLPDLFTTFAVYFSFILAGVIGLWIGKKVSVSRVIGGALASSVLFFVITNFATWLSGFCGYPMTMGGLILCYEMAIPFFRNEVLGTLVYSGVLFGAFELAKRRFPVLVK
ncbi:MAG: hypothetical protein LBH22_05075 [Bacteroidales bacterium]|jgi:hypothetical protein|nr:hypothetical protein [Bacteroidales bacterium]